MDNDKSKLRRIVSDLRNYLESPLVAGTRGGVLPASDEQRDAFEEAVRQRRKRKIESLKTSDRTPESGSANQSVRERKQQTSDGASDSPWKRHGSRPRAKFRDDSNRARTETLPEEEASDLSKKRKLEILRDYLGDCRRCPLWKNRTNIVFGEGAPDADLVFAGEAPGYHEDQQGRPFVGKAGNLLNQMIRAMGLERGDVYIANILKSRPPKNRDPRAEEIRECSPFLHKQLEIIEPEVIVPLGRFAAQTLLEKNEPLGRMRGRWHKWGDIPAMPTYHPAYLLRNERDKRKAWNDLKMVMAKLGLSS